MMSKIAAFARAAGAAFFIALGTAAHAQMGVPNHAVPVGHGTGGGIFGSVGPCLAGIPVVGAGVSADPVCGRAGNGGLAQGGAWTIKGNPTSGTADVQDFTIGALTLKVSPASNDKVPFQDAITGALGYTTIGAIGASGAGTVTGGSNGLSGGPTTLFLEQMVPGGRLTIVSGGCNVTTDQVAQTILYYAPCAGKYVPVYDGVNMAMRSFTSSDTDVVGASINLAASGSWAAGTLYDAYYGWDSGASTFRFCTGPAWTNSGAGTSARGTGAGTTEQETFKGFPTNKNSMTCRYGAASTFTCAVHQCTFLGTVMMGAGAGTVDLKFGTAAGGGGLALLSICNMYNRGDVRAASSDTTATWSYTSSTWRAANAGNTKISIVSCMGDLAISAKYLDLISPSTTSATQQISIGLNASNAIASRATTAGGACIGGVCPVSGITLFVTLDEVPPLGFNTVYAIESADNTHATTFNGQSSPYNFMQLSLSAQM
jgi:hypothetical protein